MERYVEIVPIIMEGYPDAHIVRLKVGVQSFTVTCPACETKAEAEWMGDMLCIALAMIVAESSSPVMTAAKAYADAHRAFLLFKGPPQSREEEALRKVFLDARRALADAADTLTTHRVRLAMYDVIEATLAEPHKIRVIATGKAHADAEAIIKSAR